MALERGRYRAFHATSPAHVARAQRLRAACFGLACAADIDPFDAQCSHILIEERASGELVACFRLADLWGGSVGAGYAAQFYDLNALAGRAGRMLEMGRFCVAPDHRDPDIIRLSWAALTRHVDRNSVGLLFGCTTFQGLDRAPYADVFALLGARYLAPCGVAPGIKSADAIHFPSADVAPVVIARALRVMPPLLRFYLAMGARVGNHAVPDPVLKTLHVFTALEVDAIAPARQRLMRAL